MTWRMAPQKGVPRSIRHAGKRKLLDKIQLVDDRTDQLERIKARLLAKVERPVRVIERQFGHVTWDTRLGEKYRAAAYLCRGPH